MFTYVSLVFINTGRGPTVQELALIKALSEGWIAHAGLDVLEIEPPGNNNPLLGMPNVTLSAHTASASARFDPARKLHVGRELALILNGRWPMSCVNPAVLMNSKLRRWQPVSMERRAEQLAQQGQRRRCDRSAARVETLLGSSFLAMREADACLDDLSNAKWRPKFAGNRKDCPDDPTSPVRYSGRVP